MRGLLLMIKMELEDCEMATPDDAPVTRREFRDFREDLKEHYATKADLERVKLWLVGGQIVAAGFVIEILRLLEG